VFLRGCTRGKRSQIPALSSLCVFLSGIQTILTRSQFANHAEEDAVYITPVGKQKGTLPRPEFLVKLYNHRFVKDS
jgi:hypothetical protein